MPEGWINLKVPSSTRSLLEGRGPGQPRPTGVGQLDGLRGRGRCVCMYGRISRINGIYMGDLLLNFSTWFLLLLTSF